LSHKKAQKTQRLAMLVWAACALVAVSILVLIVGAPLAAARGYSGAAVVLYQAFSVLCHQFPDRSYFIAAHKLAVCARCTGLYAGFALTLLLYPLIRPLRTIDWPRREWLLVAALPMAIDVGLTFLGVWENTHTSRLLTGLLLGGACVFYVMPGLMELSLRKTRETALNSPDTIRPTFTLASPEAMAAAPSDYSAPERRI
jgi:uncharacterized membrane protein